MNGVLDELTTDILPWWTALRDDVRGGFFGRVDGHGNLHKDAPRGAVMTARVLWTFSAAHRLLKNRDYLSVANHAKNYLLEHFRDSEFGGIYWTVDANGAPLETKKQFYALAFALYGLAEFTRTTGDKTALNAAVSLFECIERHSFNGIGYIEACTRDWQPLADLRLSDKDANSPLTMNTHLHILEAYTALLRVWPNSLVTSRLRMLIDIFLTRIVRPDGHLGLFFDSDWRVQGGGISFGHDIEASWLLLEAAQVLGIAAEVLKPAREIALAGLSGLNADGSMNYHLHDNGHLDTERHWWVQAEAVVGQLYLAKFHDIPEALTGAKRTWQYIQKHLRDPHGEWFWSVSEDGTPNRTDDKAGLWKCPYHNGRMCLEVAELQRFSH